YGRHNKNNEPAGHQPLTWWNILSMRLRASRRQGDTQCEYVSRANTGTVPI
ncbi:MAG: hypothetical protein QOE02_3744, partial [Rhodospirillaceae bacterium]|nr:hypothetical protein [Rhodospirillaceae bacterium]